MRVTKARSAIAGAVLAAPGKQAPDAGGGLGSAASPVWLRVATQSRTQFAQIGRERSRGNCSRVPVRAAS